MRRLARWAEWCLYCATLAKCLANYQECLVIAFFVLRAQFGFVQQNLGGASWRFYAVVGGAVRLGRVGSEMLAIRNVCG